MARKAGDNNEALDENQSQQWGGTGSSAQEAIIITSQSPVANKNKDHAFGDKRRADVYLPNEQIKEELSKAFCSMEDVTEDNQRNVKELMGMKQNGNTLVDYVARVDQSPSISGNEKRPCNESLSQRDLRNLLKRKRYLSDRPLNYYRYLLLKMDEALCDKDQTRLRSWIFPLHFMTYLEKGLQSVIQQYSSRVPGDCLSFEDIN